ncbi:hypothetical protein BT69DRAFT_1278622 [Atractiella rhizophila]|nr:hypothetical protein BT69DRAFT_1278622 [Atractiella rhizophila]
MSQPTTRSRPSNYSSSNPPRPTVPLSNGSSSTRREVDSQPQPARPRRDDRRREPSSNAIPAAIPRPQNPSKIGAALLKKRQSVSYGNTFNLPDFRSGAGGNVPVPDVPREFLESLEGVRPGITRQVLGTSPAMEQRKVQIDTDALAADGFNADDFLRRYLPNASEAQVQNLRMFKASLKEEAEKTSQEMQKTVFKNYSEFVTISKEISTLENDVLELKSVLEEWKKIPESLSEIGSEFEEMESSMNDRRSNRNSIGDLAALYRSQLSALWSGVEGSQRFLPPLPGRHLIAESPGFIELNSATYRPKQGVHLFLLNDALLVAVKKRAAAGGEGRGKLVADRCFDLADIMVTDMKDGGSLTNALKIKQGREVFIYRTEKAEEKRALLLAFKKVAEELMNKKRKDNIGSSYSGVKTDLRGRGEGKDIERGVLEIGKQLGYEGETWIDDLGHELEVKVKLREWDDAVDVIEACKSVNPQLSAISSTSSNQLRTAIAPLVTLLTSSILDALGQPYIHRPQVVSYVSLLLRLGQAEKARETFLKNRGDMVRKRARGVKWVASGPRIGSDHAAPGGGIKHYVAELAMVWMGMVKNTGEWYLTAFKDHRMASGFVKWASQQMELFSEMFRRQVYGIGGEDNSKIVEECIEIAMTHSITLRDVGLDFTFLLNSLLRTPIHRRRSFSGTSSAMEKQPSRSKDDSSLLNVNSANFKRISALELQKEVREKLKSPR